MTGPIIKAWLTTDEARDLISKGQARRPASIWYDSDVPTVFDGTGVHSWNDYLMAQPEQDRPYIEALRAVIVARRYKASYGWMDHGACWVPLFEDATILDYGSGGWSGLQAAIWSEEEGVQYSYRDWDFGMGGEAPVRDRFGELTYVPQRLIDPTGGTT
jgi:hypothetical protein